MNGKGLSTAVLMGGPGEEREISMASGQAVARGLREAGRTVVEIVVPETGILAPIPDPVGSVFIAMHGAFGEDGGVQRELEKLGLPYTGSGPESSHLSFDKALAKACFDRHGIPTPAWSMMPSGEPCPRAFPVVVKPPRQGSSVGLHICHQEKDWPELTPSADPEDALLVEDYIEGRELTVGIVGDQVLPIVEIRAPQGCYDYRAKYTKGLTEYLVPAPLDAATVEEAGRWARRVFEVLGARGFGRVDFRLDPSGQLLVLELNTIPGFTPTSLLPKAAAAAGLAFSDLCLEILSFAENID